MAGELDGQDGLELAVEEVEVDEVVHHLRVQAVSLVRQQELGRRVGVGMGVGRVAVFFVLLLGEELGQLGGEQRGVEEVQAVERVGDEVHRLLPAAAQPFLLGQQREHVADQRRPLRQPHPLPELRHLLVHLPRAARVNRVGRGRV